MEKTMAKTVAMINNGATWAEVEEALDFTRTYLQKLLRENYYKTAAGYNNLLARARANAKKKLEKTIIVAETGSLFVGFDIPRGVQVMVPCMCKKEIFKYAARNGKNAQKLVNNPNITWVPREPERLNVRVEKGLFKPRAIAIVSLTCKLLNEGYTVKCITTSRDVFELAGMQKVNPPKLQIVKL